MAGSDKTKKNLEHKKDAAAARSGDTKKKSVEGQGPDFLKIDPAVARSADFPAQAAGEFRVHFHPQAHEAMMQHANTTSEVELCGVLVGDVCRDGQGFFLDITGAIEGQGANNYGSQVTFTHETWSHIHAVKDQRYPDKRIVGWYHTHPGFGVFLSSMDMFIQENFFREPYQVAVVVETRQKAEGCFYWSKGRCLAARRYWVGDQEIGLAVGGAEPFDPEAKAEESPQDDRRPPRAERAEGGLVSPLALMLMAVLLFAAGLIACRMLLASSIQQMISEAAESEVAVVIEGMTRSQLAMQDFEQLRGEVRAVREGLAGSDVQATTGRVEALDKRLAALQQEYGKRPSDVRKELEALGQARLRLKDQVAAVQTLQIDLEQQVANLYLIRLAEAVGGLGHSVDPASLSETNRLVAGQCLETLIRRHPETKQQLKSMFPGLLEYFYPQEKATEPAGGEKKDGDNKGSDNKGGSPK